MTFETALSPDTLRIAAPAKINLTLHITGKRDDGYHELETLVVFAGVFDRVSLEPAERITLAISGPYADALDLQPDQDNIVLRAAWALAAATGSTQGVKITLHKTLPVAAGIGGGSADAAATLRGLCRLWKLSVPEADLMKLAAALGADVPVCLQSRATSVSGIGEILREAPALPAAWLVLVNPGVQLSTADVFKARTGTFTQPFPLTETVRDAHALASALIKRRNDMTAAAVSLAPEVGTALAALGASTNCLLSRMSGSGATCWGLFATEYEARTAARELRMKAPGWWIEPAPMLTEVDPYQLATGPALVR